MIDHSTNDCPRELLLATVRVPMVLRIFCLYGPTLWKKSHSADLRLKSSHALCPDHSLPSEAYNITTTSWPGLHQLGAALCPHSFAKMCFLKHFVRALFGASLRNNPTTTFPWSFQSCGNTYWKFEIWSYTLCPEHSSLHGHTTSYYKLYCRGASWPAQCC